ncbi:MAG TPA: class I SAM-dependent methyltransferase [Pseudomonadales bacterium]|nr:class I SAM-dependent methyltransferase [Pseudomonadales bacterium]
MEQTKIWAHFQRADGDVFEDAEARYRTLVALVARSSRRGRVLNVGIGSGGVERRFAALGWSVSSLDPDPESVERLRATGVDARCGYLQDVPFDAAQFDAIVVSEVLEHVADTDRPAAAAELRRVARTGALLVGTVPYRENLGDQETVCPACGNVFHRWGHVASFDAESMRLLLGTRFAVQRCAPRCFVRWAWPMRPRRILKNVAKLALGRLGEPIVAPSLLFVARAT